MDRYLCLHGHFYQPPRENPWLEAIEPQDSAYPYHDWNERIAAECYAPNSAARILDERQCISRIVNNYARVSFNFGPTLLSWLEQFRPDVYRSVLDADRHSRSVYGGHGAALAQAYNHLIMPLANARDKRTQVLWGLRDFVHRFGRQPEGMWLPETAVDLETLELLAQAGLKFTLLAPHQARRIRRLGETGWQEVGSAGIDPRRPYLCRLPSGRAIALFFYDGPLAQQIAFGNLLGDGERFAGRLLEGFSKQPAGELVHVATDGETYGHHHRFGEMALAYCLDRIESRGQARLTVYGEFLERFPPTHEVQIAEATSWSCAHGVERWRADCGCRTGGEAGWTQAWRGPLRQALDWLRDRLAPLYERELAALGFDPWATRDAYIEVILDRSHGQVGAFLRRHAGRDLPPASEARALRLLEMQRHALLMYTSCGWFFDEVSGLESTQILAYAGRALQLAEETAGVGLEAEFLARLEQVPSNLRRWGNAARVYRERIAPCRLDLARVAAHYAIVSGFDEPCPPEKRHRHDIYCYTAEETQCETFPAGRMRLHVGRARIRSRLTWEDGEFAFAVLNLGGHNLSAGVHPFRDRALFGELRRTLAEAFERGDVPEVVRQMDRQLGPAGYSLRHLFKDEQRRVLHQLMGQSLTEIEDSFRTIYEDHFPLLRFLHEIGMPIPRPLAVPVELVLVGEFRALLEADPPRPAELRRLTEEVERLEIPLDEPMLGLAAGRQLERQMEKLAQAPGNLALMLTLCETLEMLQGLPIRPDLWRAQNLYWSIHQNHHPAYLARREEEWLGSFRRLGESLKVRPS
jgi:alpha-amylase/alpha-mannosidase (GH57 family)